MLGDNLALLRNLKELSQEQVAEIVGVARQSYAKWEQGETIPDVEKCDRLAKFYGVSVDELLHRNEMVGGTKIAPAPRGKYLWGTVTIGGKGQIVIPKTARDTFGLKDGDRLVVLGDETEGIALVKAEDFERKLKEAMELSRHCAER